MQNVSLSKYSQIGNFEGLFFMWNCLSVDNSTLTSISILCQHSKSDIKVIHTAVVSLFEQMGIISWDNSFIINSQYARYRNCDKDTFTNWFGKTYVHFLLDDEYIDFTKITYDRVADKYVLAQSAISFKFACLRNLLVTLDIISRTKTDGKFYIEKYIDLFLEKGKSVSRKMTQEKLLKKLGKQQEQGERGELFVLEYEKKRLKGHTNIENIKRISQIDVCAGYDIVSFNGLDSTMLDRMIEVKTYDGIPHFFWSSNERKQAALLANHYFIYLVDDNKIKSFSYEPIIIQNPVDFFRKNPQWILIEDTVKVMLNETMQE